MKKDPQQKNSASWRSRVQTIEPVLVGAAAFAFYALTGARDVQWGDPAKLMQYVHDGVLLFSQEEHVGQILWSMPFSLIPVGSFAQRLHLGSALTMGAALGFAYAVLLRLGRSRPAARLAIAAVAVAHTIWFTAAIFESYPTVLLLVAAAAWLCVAGGHWLAGGALLGFGILVHPIVLFGIPGFAYGVWRSQGGMRGVLSMGAGIAAGAAVPIAGVLLLRPDNATLAGFNWASASVRYGGLGNPLRNLPMLGGYAVYNLAGPALFLLATGVRRLGRTALWTAVIFAIPHYAFAAFWLPQRAYLIPLPVYFAAAYVIALGGEELVRAGRVRRWALFVSVIGLPLVAYALAPPVFVRLGLERTLRDAPYRNEARYFLQPWKFTDHSARMYLDDLARVLPANAAVVGDWLLYTTVHSAQRIEGWRSDVSLVNASADSCGEVTLAYELGRRVFILDDDSNYVPACILQSGRRQPVPSVERLSEIMVAPRE